ncbi:MAG: hypothetical protein ABI452_00835 [Candidatus Limnocylindrales bacterium]
MTGTSTKSSTTSTPSHAADGADGDSRQPLDAVISGAQGAADVARQTAGRAAAALPDAVAGAQVYARDTQRTLEGMDDQTLMAGTTFALGLGVGLFVSGAHRLLVAAALVPAGAMAMTLLGRKDA